MKGKVCFFGTIFFACVSLNLICCFLSYSYRHIIKYMCVLLWYFLGGSSHKLCKAVFMSIGFPFFFGFIKLTTKDYLLDFDWSHYWKPIVKKFILFLIVDKQFTCWTYELLNELLNWKMIWAASVEKNRFLVLN